MADSYNFRVDPGSNMPAKRFRYQESDPNYPHTTPHEYSSVGGADEGVKPSKVLQLTGLPTNCMEIEVMSVLSRHANIIDCFMLGAKGQALVEFESLEESEHVLHLMQQQHQSTSISNCFPQVTFSPLQSLNNSSTATSTSAPSTLPPPHTNLHSTADNGDPNYHPHRSNNATGVGFYPSSSGSISSSHLPRQLQQTAGSTEPYYTNPRRQQTEADTMANRPDEHYGNGAARAAGTSDPLQGPVKAEASGGTPNKVLLFTIIRPDYPINTHVLLAVCKKFDTNPVKIYIFRRRGVQAMVEFDSIETAVNIKQNLDGADIYSGCCTLRIEFARPETLKILRNTDDTYNALLEGVETDPGLLPEPQRRGARGGPMAGYRYGAVAPNEAAYAGGPPVAYRGGEDFSRSRYPQEYAAAGGAGAEMGATMDDPNYYNGRGGADRKRQGTLPSPAMLPSIGPQARFRPGGSGRAPELADPYYVPIDELGYDDGSYGRGGYMGAHGHEDDYPVVIMMYNLHEKFGPKRLFNLLCIFGNVNKIKFLKSKAGSALAEIQGKEAVDKIFTALQNLEVFGSKLTIKPSRQPELFEHSSKAGPQSDQRDELKMPNGDYYFANFMGSRDQRFTTPQEKAKNRTQNVKKVLHAFNIPAGTTEEQIKKCFEDQESPVPNKVSILESKFKDSRKISANLFFGSVEEAVEALVLTNHAPVADNSNGKKFPLKLCFSVGQEKDNV